jgi:carboxyl-terminal processing protease
MGGFTMNRWLVSAAAALLIFSQISAQDFSEKVEKIFNSIEESKGKNVWTAMKDLEDLGRGALEDVRGGLRRADPFVRMAAAKYLYVNDFKDESLDTLLKLASESKDMDARRSAASLITGLVKGDASVDSKKKKEISDKIASGARETADDSVKVHLWLATYNLTSTLEAKRKLQEIWEKAAVKDVKDDCSLALAEMDSFHTRGLKDHLKTLAQEPSPTGRLAKAYLELNKLTEQINRALDDRPKGQDEGGAKNGGDQSKYDFKLLTEILDLLHANYRDPKRVEKEYKKMMENAAKAMTGTLDLYTTYLDPEEYEKLTKEDLGGQYGGIGARVSMRKDRNGNAWLTIEEPIFSGPAYRAGLRSNDKIIEIEGVSTANQDLQDLVRRLRGKPGTPAKIKVVSIRWEKPKEMQIVREQVQLETVQHQLLPGDIGYIKLVTFGMDEDQKIRDAIRDLQSKGAKALILDLRGNSGGYLDTSVNIANLFVEKGKTIVSIEAQNQNTPKQVHKTRREKETDLPLVTLVDGGSASASEILSGALRDLKRSKLVGEKTYGKGSVQRSYKLDTMDQKAAVKITIARWYLPSGESVEKDEHKDSGIEPTIKVTLPDPDVFKAREFERLRANPKLEAYVKGQWANNKELFYKLADADNFDTKQYPGFDELLKSLDTRASADELRELLREYIRKAVQDDRAKEYACDFQTDNQLQRAIIEVANEAKIDVKSVPAYKILSSVETPKKNE